MDCLVIRFVVPRDPSAPKSLGSKRVISILVLPFSILDPPFFDPEFLSILGADFSIQSFNFGSFLDPKTILFRFREPTYTKNTNLKKHCKKQWFLMIFDEHTYTKSTKIHENQHQKLDWFGISILDLFFSILSSKTGPKWLQNRSKIEKKR